MDAKGLKISLGKWCEAMLAAAPELNELDGKLGDGDLGTTLQKCAENIKTALPTMPDSIDGIFKTAAQACSSASGSSFGTLLAVALLGASKWVPPRTGLTQADIAELLLHAVDRLSMRGGAKLGDKTMLDSLNAIATALAAENGTAEHPTAEAAAAQAIANFRGLPNRIGRARMFGEQSRGIDDPGMVAVLRMAQSLEGSAQ